MTQMDIKIPWSNWEVTKFLGGGSFGAVYEITRTLFGGEAQEKAAVKVISVPKDKEDAQELISNGYKLESINERYLQDLQDIAKEYSMMAKLKGNANIVYCDDLHYEQNTNGVGWTLYIKMELLTPLNKALGDQISEKQTIKLGMDLCNALSACKKNNIIHRDIKPANIMVAKDGNYKLGDFGVAKTTERTAGGTKTGTYNYMAPEVYNNQPYGLSVDIYSLGMVMYWMLNGRCGPFLPLPPTVPTALQIDEAKQKRFSGTPLPAPAFGCPRLKQIVLKACAYDPAQRYQTPEELYADLVTCQSKGFDNSTIPPFGNQESNRQEQSANRNEQTYGENEKTQGNAWENEYDATQGSVHSESRNDGGTVGGDSTSVKGLGPYDVKLSVKITQQESASGCQKLVQLPNGKKISVKIPAGIREGTMMRVIGAGKEDPHTGAKGNGYIEVHIGAADSGGFSQFGDIFKDFFGGNIVSPEKSAVICPSEAQRGCKKTFKFEDGTEKTVTIPAGCKDKQIVDGVCIYVYDLKSEPKDFRKLPDAVVQAYANKSTGIGRNMLLAMAGWMIFGMSTMMIPIMAGGLFVSAIVVVAVGVKKSQTIEAAKQELAIRKKKRAK